MLITAPLDVSICSTTDQSSESLNSNPTSPFSCNRTVVAWVPYSFSPDLAFHFTVAVFSIRSRYSKYSSLILEFTCNNPNAPDCLFHRFKAKGIVWDEIVDSGAAYKGLSPAIAFFPAISRSCPIVPSRPFEPLLPREPRCPDLQVYVLSFTFQLDTGHSHPRVPREPRPPDPPRPGDESTKTWRKSDRFW